MNMAQLMLIVSAVLILGPQARAGLLMQRTNASTSKCCGCTAECQPRSCRPQIVRPTRFHNPGHNRCSKPDACYQVDVSGVCAPISLPPNACVSFTEPCTQVAVSCDDQCLAAAVPHELVVLIQRSQTCTHAWERRDAVHKLSNRYSCRCYPQVMPALICALSDVDHRVRSKAADEIGDQLRESPLCCSPSVLAALQHALGDCDRFVRRYAEHALTNAGYDVVDGCCPTPMPGNTLCVPNYSTSVLPPAPGGEAQSVPPTDPGHPSVPPSPGTVPAENSVAPPPPESTFPHPQSLRRTGAPDQLNAPVPGLLNVPSAEPVSHSGSQSAVTRG